MCLTYFHPSITLPPWIRPHRPSWPISLWHTHTWLLSLNLHGKNEMRGGKISFQKQNEIQKLTRGCFCIVTDPPWPEQAEHIFSSHEFSITATMWFHISSIIHPAWLFVDDLPNKMLQDLICQPQKTLPQQMLPPPSSPLQEESSFSGSMKMWTNKMLPMALMFHMFLILEHSTNNHAGTLLVQPVINSAHHRFVIL